LFAELVEKPTDNKARSALPRRLILIGTPKGDGDQS